MRGWRDGILGLMGALLVAGVLGGVQLAIAQGKTDTRVDSLKEEVKRNDSETKKAVKKVNDDVETNGRNIVKLLVKMGVDPE